jgi:hypothetical protein
MGDIPWSIRRAVAGDGDFLADMLVAAVNWSSERPGFVSSLNRIRDTDSSRQTYLS